MNCVAENQYAIFQCERFEFREDVSLRVEQQADGALAGCEVAHVAGEHGVQVADAIRSRKRKDGTEDSCPQRCVLARQAILAGEIAELRGQGHAEI